MFNSPFAENTKVEKIKSDIAGCDVIFVADMFADQ